MQVYPVTDWEVIVQRNSGDVSSGSSVEYDVALSSKSCPEGSYAWKVAKEAYNKNFGGGWF